MKLLKRLHDVYYEVFNSVIVMIILCTIYILGVLTRRAMPDSRIVRFFSVEPNLNNFWRTFFTGTFELVIILTTIAMFYTFICAIKAMYNEMYIVYKRIQIRKRLYNDRAYIYECIITEDNKILEILHDKLSDVVITKNIYKTKKNTILKDIEYYFHSEEYINIHFCDSLGNTEQDDTYTTVVKVFKDLN